MSAARLHVRVHDGGDAAPPIVLVHGSMDRGAAFARVVPHLGARRAVRYDRRGYGGSIDAGPPVGIDGHATDLLAVIEEHGRGAAVVVGHSLGGDVALAAAARQPDLVLAVGAYETPMPWLPWWPEDSAGGATIRAGREGGPGAAAETFLRRMLGDDRWESLHPDQQASRRREGPALLAELLDIRGPEPPFDLAAVRCPVEVARGGESVGHHRRTAEELARAVGAAGPAVIEGAAHGAHLTHPAAFAAWAGAVRALVNPDR